MAQRPFDDLNDFEVRIRCWAARFGGRKLGELGL